MYPSMFTLNTGAQIPSIGLGTWQAQPKELEEALIYAIDELGYRLIDTAWGYGNEVVIGNTLKKLRTPRQELFITTKLFGTYHTRVERGLRDSLRKLQVDYVDLFLMHWPVPLPPTLENYPHLPSGDRHILPESEWSYLDTWKEMEKVYKKGLCKGIGVSNMSIKYLERISQECEVIPAVNQIELHPFLPQHELVKYCQRKGIQVQGYSPLGSTDSPLLKDSEILEIAKNYNATAAQVLLSWQVANTIIPLPKSTSQPRLRNNISLIRLSDLDLETLNSYSRRHGTKRFIDPPWGKNIGSEDGFCERRESEIVFRSFDDVFELVDE